MIDNARSPGLSQAVRKAFDWMPELDASHILIEVTGSMVTLAGSVPSESQLALATRTALGVEGIDAVANDISVHLPWQSPKVDGVIAVAVSGALGERRDVAVAVVRGVVTLTGVVDSQSECQAAGDTAAGVEGVLSVTNLITLRASS